jgi:hypothetical protein
LNKMQQIYQHFKEELFGSPKDPFIKIKDQYAFIIENAIA